MIVRIMGEGQLDLSEADFNVLEEFDQTIEQAIESENEEIFQRALRELLDKVREDGTPLAADSLEPSQFILPPADASMAEVRSMLGDEGLIPDLA